MASGLCIEDVPQIQTVAVFSDHRLSWQKVVEILPTPFLQGGGGGGGAVLNRTSWQH